jgi:hypothetical protein
MDNISYGRIHLFFQGVIPMYVMGKPAYPNKHEMPASGRTIEREG